VTGHPVILFEVLPKIFDKEYAMTAIPSIDLPAGWPSSCPGPARTYSGT
jgi:hypothetical protein